MCKILCVSEAGYYKYKRNPGKPGKDETLSAAIKSIIDESEYNDNLGVPGMQLALMQRNIKAGPLRITRLMREMGAYPQAAQETERSYKGDCRSSGTREPDQAELLR